MHLVVAAESASAIPDWLSAANLLLAGVGIGAVMASLIAFLGGWRQRVHDARQRDRDHKHELALRQQQFEHERRLEGLRDRQRLRDVRLDRLRTTLLEVGAVAFNIDRAAWDVEIGEPTAQLRLREALRQTDAVRTRLLLESPGHELDRCLSKIRRAALNVVRSEDRQEALRILSDEMAGLMVKAMLLLEDIERQPLDADTVARYGGVGPLEPAGNPADSGGAVRLPVQDRDSS